MGSDSVESLANVAQCCKIMQTLPLCQHVHTASDSPHNHRATLFHTTHALWERTRERQVENRSEDGGQKTSSAEK